MQHRIGQSAAFLLKATHSAFHMRKCVFISHFPQQGNFFLLQSPCLGSTLICFAYFFKLLIYLLVAFRELLCRLNACCQLYKAAEGSEMSAEIFQSFLFNCLNFLKYENNRQKTEIALYCHTLVQNCLCSTLSTFMGTAINLSSFLTLCQRVRTSGDGCSCSRQLK